MTREDRIHGRPNHRGRAERRARRRRADGAKVRVVGVDEAAPAAAASAPAILPGLPGGPPYQPRRERVELESAYRLEGMAHIAARKIGGLARHVLAERLGLPPVTLDVDRERRRLVRERAAALGISTPAAAGDRQEDDDVDRRRSGILVPKRSKPKARPRLWTPKGDR